MRTTLGVVLSALVAALIINRRDIERYVRIRQMSQGDGHPEYVPVHGRAAYPQD